MFFKEGASVAYNYPPPPTWISAIGDLIGKYLEEGNRKVLDLGCGPGRFIDEIYRNYDCDCFGLDYSNVMLHAAKNETSSDIHYIQADAASIPFPGATYDVVLIRYLLHHVPCIERIIDDVFRILTSGGFCILETADPLVLKQREVYAMFPDIAELDLNRWPPISTLIQQAQNSGFHFVSDFRYKNIRGTQTKSEYIAWLKKWKHEGGGTSFWGLFDFRQREKYANFELSRIQSLSDDYKRDIFTESVFLQFTK